VEIHRAFFVHGYPSSFTGAFRSLQGNKAQQRRRSNVDLAIRNAQVNMKKPAHDAQASSMNMAA
jgi:hypothetical protein